MHFYSIHVIVKYNQAGSEIICRQIIVKMFQVRTKCFLGLLSTQKKERKREKKQTKKQTKKQRKKRKEKKRKFLMKLT